ncbi:hypothetical protein [Roseovarius sp. ZX-A-9]|uniref:hypothetical protein n=1 Tax=Roseovarius sp. ZX-A-9 TaxID=3014783 RepID=UPI00232B7268|nr:hypothetical protein [Roseovarius sp. ZX-A-9]
MKHFLTLGAAICGLCTAAQAAEPTAHDVFDAFSARYERLYNDINSRADPGRRRNVYRSSEWLMDWPLDYLKAFLFKVPEKNFCEPAVAPGHWICTFILPIQSEVGNLDPGSDDARLEILEKGRTYEEQHEILLVSQEDGFMAPDIFIIKRPNGERAFHYGPQGCVSVGTTKETTTDGQTRVPVGSCLGGGVSLKNSNCELIRRWFVEKNRPTDTASLAFWVFTPPLRYVACIEGTDLDPGIDDGLIHRYQN